MKKRSRDDVAFAARIGQQFRDAIEKHRLTREQAAKELGVKRASIYKYLNGTVVPGSNVLQRACERWGITLDYRGLRLDAAQFSQTGRSRSRARSEAPQLALPFATESLKGKHLELKIRPANSNTIVVTLRVRVAG